MILTQFHAKPKVLRSDNGGEYVSLAMKQFFLEHDLVHQTSCPNISQQNGVAERKNRTLLEISRALMFEARMPVRFQPLAIATATYLTNRLPTKSLHFQTPRATVNTFTTISSSHSLSPRIFGCVVYVHLSSSEDLSWLIHPLVDSRDQKEQVGNTADIAIENTVSPSPQATPVPKHPVEQEVTPNPPSIDMSKDDTMPRR